MPTLDINGGQVLNVGVANNYQLLIGSVVSTGGAPDINVPLGATVTVLNFTPGDKPINVGQGRLALRG